MASGKTETLNQEDWITTLAVREKNRLHPRETRARDRSLSGKGRRKQRKLDNKKHL